MSTNRTFPAHPPAAIHQIRPEDAGRIRDIAEAEEQAYADAARADLHGSLIAAMLRNPLVSEVDLSDDAEPEGEPADIGEDDTFDPPTSGRPLEPGHRIVITLHASRQRHLADVTFVGERYTEYVRQDGVRGRIGLDREGWAFGDDRVQIWDGDDDGADDGVHRASSQAGLAAVRMSLPAVVQLDHHDAAMRLINAALDWQATADFSAKASVQEIAEFGVAKIRKQNADLHAALLTAARDYRQAVQA